MTGHVRRRGARSWEIKFDLGTDPQTGKRLTRYHSFKGTKREAEDELVRLKAGAIRGDYVDPSKTSVADFLDRWQRDWVTGNVSPKTADRWHDLVRLHIAPNIGAMPIQKLRAVHLTELYGKLLRAGRGDTGLAPRTVGHVHRTLHRALGHAAQWGLVQSNVAALVSPPRVASVELEILTAPQTQRLLDTLRGRPLYIIVATQPG